MRVAAERTANAQLRDSILEIVIFNVATAVSPSEIRDDEGHGFVRHKK